MEDGLINFVTFLQDAGIHFDDKAIRFVKSPLHGYGVIARRDIAVGTIIARVPKTAILSVETATLWRAINKRKLHDDDNDDENDVEDNDDEADSDAHPRDDFCPPMFQLPAAVLFESLLGKESLWCPYLYVLSPSLSEIGVPIGETEDTIKAWFGGTGIDILTLNMRINLKTVFESSVQQLFQQRALELNISADAVKRATWQDFSLAFAWVTSRAFQVDEIHGNSMVPVADMFNHSTDSEHVHIEGVLETESDDSDEEEDVRDGRDCERDKAYINGTDGGTEIDVADHSSTPDRVGQGEQNCQPDDQLSKARDELDIVCVRKVMAEEEMFNTFGQKCNTVLYLNYGFTEADNMYDTAFLNRDDVEDVLNQFCKNISTECRMESERRACIDAAGVLIYEDVIDDYFQIVTDGTFCHGLLLLIYLFVVPWATIAPLCDNEPDLLDHLMQLSIQDILEAGRTQVADIAKSIVQRIESGYPDGSSIAKDKDLLSLKNLSPVRKHALRIRIGQRKALNVACEKLFSQADDPKGCCAERVCKKAKTS